MGILLLHHHNVAGDTKEQFIPVEIVADLAVTKTDSPIQSISATR